MIKQGHGVVNECSFPYRDPLFMSDNLGSMDHGTRSSFYGWLGGNPGLPLARN